MKTPLQQLFALIAIAVFLSNAFQGADILVAFFRGSLVFVTLLVGSRFCLAVYRIIMQGQKTTDKSPSRAETDKTQVV